MFEPAKPMPGSEGKRLKYEVTMVFDPGKFDADEKARFNQMLKLLDDKCVEKFKKHWKELDGSYKKGIRKGEEKDHLSGFGPGLLFAKASSFMQPKIVGPDGVTKIVDPAKFYPGCYARASVSAYHFTNVSKGVAFGLNNLMFIADGERLDSRTDPEDDFGEFATAGVAAAGALDNFGDII